MLRGRARWLRAALLPAVFVGLLSAGCGDDADHSAADARRPSRAGLFFTVRSPTATAYLLGTIHFGRPDFYPLDEPIMAAFGRAEALVLEAEVFREDAAAGAALRLSAAAQLPPGDSLDNHVTPETLALLRQYLEATAGHRAEQRIEELMRLRPWAVAWTVAGESTAGIGLMPKLGVEEYLLREGGGRKRVMTLETVQEQIDTLADHPDTVQDAMLRSALERMPEAADTAQTLVEAWLSGDLATLERLVREEYAYPGLAPMYQRFFLDRNVRMAEKIRALLATEGTFFVAVGAGHLVGEGGIPALLRRAGLEVQQGYP